MRHYYITINKEKEILRFMECTNPHDTDCEHGEIKLTEREFRFAKAVDGDLFTAALVLSDLNHLIRERASEII